MAFCIDEELKKLPAKPGVYIMHDEQDTLLYVGKAVNLRNRVRSYFRENIGRGPQIDKMVSLIARFEYIVTDSELEALILENNLIKEHLPKYNTLLKDDKTYPYIKVTVGEAYPRILFVREMKKDKARYFGPYTSAGAVKDTIELLNKLYKLRTCNRSLPKDIGEGRPCLNYHIGQCSAPCQNLVSREEYREQVEKAIKELDFFVDIDLFMTDSAKLADIVLPCCSSFERSEFKVFGGGFGQYTEPVIAPLGESRPDDEIICELARRLDVDAMQRAAEQFVGKHDFLALCAAGSSAAAHGDTVRTITDCHVTRKGDEVDIEVTADGYLYNMVRILAGTLCEVGAGRMQPDAIPGILASRDRSQAGPTLPAKGLFLEKVDYDL